MTSPTTTGRIVALVGPKHVGKTTVARATAEIVGWRWADVDHLMTDRARDEGWFASDGSLVPVIRQLHRRVGKQAFLDWEGTTLERFLNSVRSEDDASSSSPSSWILATGGGICDNEPAFALLRQHARLLYLSDDPLVLYERVQRWGLPSFLDAQDPRGDFIALCERRDVLYRSAATQVIDLRGQSQNAAIEIVTDAIRGMKNGR